MAYLASDSTNQYPIGLRSSPNSLNPTSFNHYFPIGGIEASIQPSALLVDPYTGNQMQGGHSLEFSYWQSYSQQAVVHPDVAAYALPQYPVYAVAPQNDDPYGMPPGLSGMLNTAGQMYPAIPNYHQPTSMEVSTMMASETCAPSDSRNYKRVQCRHFAAGMCVRGATCGFKHGEHDTGDSLQAMVLPPMVPMISHLNAGKPFRVVPCQHWLAGNCRKGGFCTFRHEFPAVNPTVSSSSSTQQQKQFTELHSTGAFPQRQDGPGTNADNKNRSY